MILQIDCVPNSSKWRSGFYRIMVPGSGERLPSYWMYNGVWHSRRPPHLNPPREWLFT